MRQDLYRERRYETPGAAAAREFVEAWGHFWREVVRASRFPIAVLALAKWLERRR